MPQNKIIATVEKIARSKIWLTADERKFFLPVELWTNAKIGDQVKIALDGGDAGNDPRKMLEQIIN